MENNKYLILARQARAEGNSEDAKTYYNKVREENPEDGEAKFFYAFGNSSCFGCSLPCNSCVFTTQVQ